MAPAARPDRRGARAAPTAGPRRPGRRNAVRCRGRDLVPRLARCDRDPKPRDTHALVDEGHRLQITLADFDRGALQLAQSLAREYGLSDCIDLRQLNVLDPDRLAASFGPGAYDVIDILGLFEYLPDHDRASSRGDRQRVTLGAVGLLRAAIPLLKPGGTPVLGTMLDTHPQLRFTLGVIQWPYITPHSVAEVQALLAAAGVAPDAATAQAAEDGVYAVYVFHAR